MTSPASQKPIPQPSDLAAPYWEAARQGRLKIQRCRDCRFWVHFPDVRCPRCGSEHLAFEAVSGQGRISTFTFVHRTFVAGFEGDVPYPVAWIDLVEQPGLRVFADLADTPAETVAIGLPVEVVFSERAGWGTIPSFRPAASGVATDHSSNDEPSNDGPSKDREVPS